MILTISISGYLIIVYIYYCPIEKLDVKNDVKNDAKNDVKNGVKNEVKNWDSFLRHFFFKNPYISCYIFVTPLRNAHSTLK